MERETCSPDISIVLHEIIDELRDEGNSRLLVGGRVQQAIDLELVQHLPQFLFSRQPGNCSSVVNSIRSCTIKFTAAIGISVLITTDVLK